MNCDCDECRRIMDQESPGPWSTLMVVLAVLGFLAMLMLRRGGC